VARHVILGGTGFIGRHVALSLLRRGERVVLAGRTPPAEPPPDVDSGLWSFVPVDLASAPWSSLLYAGDVVHHYAWSTIPGTANDNPLADLDVNLRGTLRLLDALRRLDGVRLVFASSGGTVYGPARRLPIPETHPLEPVTAYGVSKVAAEKYLGFYRAAHGLDCRIARISNPFGVGQDPHRRQGAASIFLQRALAGEPIEIWGDGGIVRDYIHITDLVSGLLALSEARLDCASDDAVFNIGTGEGTSLRQLLALLEAQLGRSLKIRILPGRGFDVPVNVLDITRASDVLGWRPKLDLRLGLERTAADYAAKCSIWSGMDTSESTAFHRRHAPQGAAAT
jgi:UDP-glucose 4-epimerase